MFFQTYKRSESTIAQKLYFELSPKFSDSAVILAIAVSKRCTQETCSCENARLEYWIIVFYHAAIPENFSQTNFSLHMLT